MLTRVYGTFALAYGSAAPIRLVFAGAAYGFARAYGALAPLSVHLRANLQDLRASSRGWEGAGGEARTVPIKVPRVRFLSALEPTWLRSLTHGRQLRGVDWAQVDVSVESTQS